MRELPFGARVSDSFIKKMKWDTIKFQTEVPGALPCLCVVERRRREARHREGPPVGRIDFEKSPKISPVNRLVPHKSPPVMLIKERVWFLRFDNRAYPAEATFEIDGLELHISKQAQVELKDSTILVVGDRIVVKHKPV